MALPGQGQEGDNEVLGLPQNYLTHNHAPPPSQCAWLLAGATCNMSPPKEADEGKTTGQQNGQREETVGSSSCQDPLHFRSGRGLIDLAVSHSLMLECSLLCLSVQPRCNLTFLYGDVQVEVG